MLVDVAVEVDNRIIVYQTCRGFENIEKKTDVRHTIPQPQQKHPTLLSCRLVGQKPLAEVTLSHPGGHA